MTGIRKLAAGALLGAGLCVSAVLGAPAASADEASYLARIEDYGFTGPVDVALDIGYAACGLSADGYYIEDIAEMVYQNTGASVNRADSAYLVDQALIYLC